MSGFISFVLPFNASQEDVLAGIAAIQKQFNLTNPTQLTVVATAADDADDTGGGVGPVATDGLDKNGLPWDERIHSSSKNTNADGTWRYRKGVSPTIRAKVEAELKGAVAAPANPTGNISVSLPSPPALVTPQLPLPVAPLTTPYSELVDFLAQHTNSASNPTGRLTADWIKQALGAYGVPSGDLQNLAHNEELTKTVHGLIKQALGL